MQKNDKPRGYWTLNRCHKEAMKCKTRSEFEKRFASAYVISGRKGFRDEICFHMSSKNKPNGFWYIKQNCLNAALKCKNRPEFQRRFGAAQKIAYKNGWLDDMFTHMISSKNRKGFWSKSRCIEIAREYKTIAELRAKEAACHSAIHRCDYTKDAFEHMIKEVSKGHREIRDILQYFDIKFIEEKRFKKCKDIQMLRFDFYLPKENICIEHQGQQHYFAQEIYGGEESLYAQKRRDQIKRYFCKNNNMKLIEISYKDYKNIKQILIKEIDINSIKTLF